MRGTPAEMGGLQPLSGVRPVVLMDGSVSGKAVAAVEYLTGVLIGQIAVPVVAQPADGLIGLVEPDGTAPVAVRGALGVVRGGGGERYVSGEFGRVGQQPQGLVHLFLRGNLHPERSIALAGRLGDKAAVGEFPVAEVPELRVEEIIRYLSAVVRGIEVLPDKRRKLAQQPRLEGQVGVQVHALLVRRSVSRCPSRSPIRPPRGCRP